MKKIGMILLIILTMCFIPKVYAAEGVAIESVDLDSKSTNAVIVSDATFEGLSLKFDIKFDDIDDFVKYKLVIKNSTDTSYELTESTSSSSYITYEYSYEDDSKVLAGNTSKTMFITIKYSNAVPIEEFSGGNYTETKSFTINLEDGTDEVVDVAVPSTVDSLYCYLVLLVGTLVFSIALLKVTKNKKFLVLIIASMILIPLNIHAIESLQITVESKVEINNPNEVTETIYWAIQEGEEGYRLVISNREKTGIHSGSFAGTSSFTYNISPPWMNIDYLSNYFVEVKVEGRVVPTSTAYWFPYVGWEVDETKYDLTNLNTINVTSMEGMFYSTGYGSETLNLDLSTFDTSNVANMEYMFDGTGKNVKKFNLNLSGWNTSKVENMDNMFVNIALDATERVITLPETNGNGIANTSTKIYGKDESVYADINKKVLST